MVRAILVALVVAVCFRALPVPVTVANEKETRVDPNSAASANKEQVLIQWIVGRVFSPSRDPSDPGTSALRRLNRLEYGNTIRDLRGVEFDTSVEFPPDDSGDSFDNNADALSISPMLAEKYVATAREIVDRADSRTRFRSTGN
ncbi:MAG: DUF1587 domain-containing protein [Pirellulaceae bacterium]|nr:DUF1587 domain-containing protein [Pirellulaceae bacterium]